MSENNIYISAILGATIILTSFIFAGYQTDQLEMNKKAEIYKACILAGGTLNNNDCLQLKVKVLMPEIPTE